MAIAIINIETIILAIIVIIGTFLEEVTMMTKNPSDINHFIIKSTGQANSLEIITSLTQITKDTILIIEDRATEMKIDLSLGLEIVQIQQKN